MIESSIVRSGGHSLKFPSTAGSGNNQQIIWVFTSGRTYFVRFYLYLASNPASVEDCLRMETGSQVNNNLQINTDGTVTLLVGGASQATSAALDLGAWNLVEAAFAWTNATSVVGQMKINGVDSGSFTVASTQVSARLLVGPKTTTSVSLYMDDFVLNDNQGAADNTFAGAAGTMILLIPTADSAKGTGWTNDAASSTSLFPSVDNEPPAGVADTTVGTGLHQIRNATSNASVSYDATMQTYTAAGVPTGATVNEVTPVVITAAPVTTSAKSGTVGVVSNPTITNVALGPGELGTTAGTFWAGATAGTFPAGWKHSSGTPAHAPSVTLGTAPVMRVTQVTSSTRIAMVCFMGIYVDYTPATPAGHGPAHRTPLAAVLTPAPSAVYL